MKTLNALFASVLVMIVVKPAFASDQAFGNNTIELLASDSDLVVEVAQALEVASASPRIQLFRLQLKDRAWGDFSADQLLMFVPRSAGAVEADRLRNTLVFLAGPLDATQLSAWQIDTPEPIFQVAGGKGGIVEVTPELRTGIDQYYTTAKDASSKDGFDWAAKYMFSSDPFLQRSAIYRLDRYRTDAALNVLGNAARSTKVWLRNRELAVHMIAAAGTEQSLELLKDIAENPELRWAVRVTSIYAIDDVPGGIEQLEKWTTVPDGVLKGTAKKAIQRASPN